MSEYFPEIVSNTDEELQSVVEWIAKNKPDLEAPNLAPDFLIPPDLSLALTKDSIRWLAERCKKLFNIAQVVDFTKPPSENNKVILLAHEFWDFRDCSISPHCVLLPVLFDDSAEVILRQLIVLRLAHAVYDGDLRKTEWLFKKGTSFNDAPIHRFHVDFHFDGTLSCLLHEYELKNPPTDMEAAPHVIEEATVISAEIIPFRPREANVIRI